MKSEPERDKIKAERTKQRKQAKRQHRDEAKTKREAKWNEKLSRMNLDATIKRTMGEIEANRKQEEADRKHEEEALRDFKRQADELAAQVKAVIEADRAAGRETDLWEWLKDAPCVVTKALRERGISLGKRKR